MIRASEFDVTHVTEMKSEFSEFVSWDGLKDYHGHKVVEEILDPALRRDGPSAIDEVLVPEQIRTAWSRFENTPRTADDVRDLARAALDVLKLGFIRPYIRDIQLTPPP